MTGWYYDPYVEEWEQILPFVDSVSDSDSDSEQWPELISLMATPPVSHATREPLWHEWLTHPLRSWRDHRAVQRNMEELMAHFRANERRRQQW